MRRLTVGRIAARVVAVPFVVLAYLFGAFARLATTVGELADRAYRKGRGWS